MRFFSDIKVFAIHRNFHVLLMLMVVAGFVLLYASCDTPEEVKPAEGQVFIKLFGGNGTEEGMDLVQTADGGFVMVGYSTSANFEASANNGGKDVYVVRADHKGDILWQRLSGGAGDDIGNSVIIDENGNILVCGERTQDDNPSLRDTYVLNYSVDGSLLGEYTFGDSLRDEFGTDILDIDGSGFLITSTWNTSDTSKYYIVETDVNLTALDKRSRYVAGSEGVANLSTRSIERTNISDLEPPFICFGSAQEVFDNSPTVFKFQSFLYRSNDDEGIAEKLYGPDDSESFCTNVDLTSDGGYVMCGYNVSGGTSREMVVKLDRQRGVDLLQIYENEFGSNVSNTGIFQTRDGGFMVISTIELADPLNDEISLLKLNNLGEEQWRNTYGSNDDDIGRNIIQLEDGSYVLVGTVGFEINPDSQSKMCLMKINPNGELVSL